MIAVNLSEINQYFHPSPKPSKENPQNATQIICMEFLGARLSSCSSLLYLSSEGLVYYTSTSGDSYIIKINAELSQESES